MMINRSRAASSARHRAIQLALITVCSVLVPSPFAFAKSALAGPMAVRRLVESMRSGGYVLVMRHAESPLTRPTQEEAAAGNVHRERQLDAAGSAAARAIGEALRKLAIPIGPIYSSPTFRARQTIRLAGLNRPMLVPQLAESARGMAVPVRHSRAQWLRKAVRRRPPDGTNTLIVTHTPNIVGAFGRAVRHTQAAEMMVFKPVSGHRAQLVGRIRAAEWEALAR